MPIYESAENYLETILVLEKRNSHVRSIDIANEMEYTKASVSVAMKALRTSGHITVDEDGSIHLTESGLAIAEQIYERHCILTEFLVSIGVDKETAMHDACKIEHHLSDTTFAMLKKHIEKK